MPPLRVTVLDVVSVVNAPVVGVVAPTVPLMLIEAVPVRFVTVPDEGVPRAPPLTTKAPAVPVFVANAPATPVPRPEMPVETGRPVAFVSVTADGVPRLGVVRIGDVDNTMLPVPVTALLSVTPPYVRAPPSVVVPATLALPASHRSLNFSDELPMSTVLVVLGVTAVALATTS